MSLKSKILKGVAIFALLFSIFCVSAFAVDDSWTASMYAEGVGESPTYGLDYGVLGGVLMSSNYTGSGPVSAPSYDSSTNTVSYTINLNARGLYAYVAVQPGTYTVVSDSEYVTITEVSVSEISGYTRYVYYTSSRQTYTSDADKSGYTWYKIEAPDVNAETVVQITFVPEIFGPSVSEILDDTGSVFSNLLLIMTGIVNFIGANVICQIPIIFFVLISLCIVIKRFIVGV